MARQSVAQVVIRFLKDRGVRYIFGVSGHSVFELTDAIYQEQQIDFVPTQIEISAAYMADAYARATRGVAVCLGSSGAGTTNLVTGVAQAFKESSPVIALAADVETSCAGKGASSWHETPQEEIFRPITKMSVTLKAAEDVFDVLSEAYRQATSGRKGPVYVGLPDDLQAEEVEVDGFAWREPPTGFPAVDPALISQVAEELAAATSPTIIAGGGVHWAQAEDELRALAELLQAPFGTSHTQKGLISEDHPLSLGVLGFGSFPYANKACLESDVILAVGTTFSEGLTQGYEHGVIPPNAKIIHVDIDPGEIGKSYPVHLGIVGDARQVLSALVAELRRRSLSRSPSGRVQRIAEEKKSWREELARRGSPTDGPITTGQLYHALRLSLPEDTLVVAEGGTGEFSARFPATSKVLESGDFRAIGHGISTAIGTSYAFSQRRVVCVSGDGAFMMELQELATAVRSGFPIVFVVVHNDAYGAMKRDQIRHLGGRVIGTELLVPDLVTLGTSFGLQAERVERPSDLAGAIGRAFGSGRPALLDTVCPIEGI